MCDAFSGYIFRDYTIIWKAGIDSHDSLFSMFPNNSYRNAVKFEITPNSGYLHPEGEWTFNIDDEPTWFSDAHRKEAYKAWRAWKREVYGKIRLTEARNPISPLVGDAKNPRHEDIENLIAFTMSWDQTEIPCRHLGPIRSAVGDSVCNEVSASAWESVWNSLPLNKMPYDTTYNVSMAYILSLFDVWGGNYKWQPVVDLWRRGFVPSFDGATWQLHSGRAAKVVYTW